MDTAGVMEELYQEDVYHIPGKTLIILDSEWTNAREEDITLLSKILGSVKLSLPEVQVICLEKMDIKKVLPLNPRRVLIFGTLMDPDIPTYETRIIDNIPVLRSDKLSTLDDAKKKSLWLALKEMFTNR